MKRKTRYDLCTYMYWFYVHMYIITLFHIFLFVIQVYSNFFNFYLLE